MMPGSPFLTDHNPPIGVAERLADDLEVVTAPNASPMTFTGTRSYILGGAEVAVIDPGPASEAHLQALLVALKGRVVEAIFVTHAHLDHSPLAVRLAGETGAPLYGCARALAEGSQIGLDVDDLGGREGIDPAFLADVELGDGERVSGSGWELEAVHTPGHLSDHMCFSDGARLFSGDHVMGWATSMISPPEGNLTAFMASLEKLLERSEGAYFPGHGAPIEDGVEIARYLLAHRKGREAEILEALRKGPRDVAGLTAHIYAHVDRSLHGAAGRNVLAHLIDLYGRDVVRSRGPFSAQARFELAQK